MSDTQADICRDGSEHPSGRFITEDGLEWYRIDGFDLLDPFLVNVVTPDDQWIFASSSGALTAGRGSAQNALFPYETDDRLHRSGGRTGPLTVIRIEGHGLWQPFSADTPLRVVTRSISKTVTGERLRFEEHHPELGLRFRYTWAAGGRFGLVRSAELLADEGREPIGIELLDGLVDLLPSGVELETQQSASTLVDAYRRSELLAIGPNPGPDSDPDPDSVSGSGQGGPGTATLALFSLEALVSDRPDPAESLTATAVWSIGLDNPVVALSDRQLRRFRSGGALEAEHLVTGRKGSFLQSVSAVVTPETPLRWLTVADVGQDHSAVAALRRRLLDPTGLEAEVASAVAESQDVLAGIVGQADGMQESADRRVTVHHYANVLFNCMRGGAFLDDHRVEVADVVRFVGGRNRPAQTRFAGAVASLDPVVEIDVLRQAVSGDADLQRIVNEYLPLTFSRRHGDPSRPWNSFQIPNRSSSGRPAPGYEGNWRDIFQNWEALLHSFPLYCESVVAKFLNASTLDGHNPYRITDEGIDWEIPEHGAWGNLGYWGDHQIVYLHRLLETTDRFHPGLLQSKLNERLYSYADVPYRIRPYEDLLADPKHTIDFDHELQAEIDDRVARIGSDGQLVPDAAGSGVHRGSLAEKLLVPALAKLSNLVADGGIWLNTQRPEWNDANNALVGHGVSVITMLHLRHYLSFIDRLLGEQTSNDGEADVELAAPIATWIGRLESAFIEHAGRRSQADALSLNTTSAVDRRALLDELGRAYSRYRAEVYDNGPGQTVSVPIADLRRFIAAVRPHLDSAAAAAERSDDLYHTYWMLELRPAEDGPAGSKPATAELEAIYPMLEGQVAALTSVAAESPAPAPVLGVVDSLFDSELYRPDQQSFVLYPPRRPPSFTEKNQIPETAIGPALRSLIDGPSDLVGRDGDGVARFASDLSSPRRLAERLHGLPSEQQDEVRSAYEAVFRHRWFTGRSQTMYRYEGIGSIYWHMVSKLLFALQERIADAVDRSEDPAMIARLGERYRQVRAGLGHMKPPATHGSFPTDPHSHTPAHTGAQQPGMTGQVKEGVLIRWGELGVRIDGGQVRFQPMLLDEAEFLTERRRWSAISSPDGPDGLHGWLEPGSLGFTFCGTPIVYHLDTDRAWSRTLFSSGCTVEGGPELDRDTSRALFARRGELVRIDVGVERSALLAGPTA